MAFTFGTPSSSAGASKPQFGTTPASGSSLFGGNTNQGSSATGGSLFGNTAASSGPPGNMFAAAASNTPASSAGGSTLFGSTTPAAPSTGGFQFSTTPASSAGGGFSLGPAASSAAPSANLFGATPAKPGPTSLFGNPSSTPSTGAPSSNLFGSTPAAGSGNMLGGNRPTLFGSTPASSTSPTPAVPAITLTTPAQTASTSAPSSANAPSAAPASGGLFNIGGNAPAAPSNTLFGSGNTTLSTPQAPQANSTPSLLGNSQQPGGGTLFRAKPPTPTATSASASTLFGGSIMQPNNPASQSTTKLSTNQPAPLFSSLGAAPAVSSLSSSQQQQQVVPAVRIDLSNIKPTTRFFELHDDVQKQIALVDDFIQTQISLFAQCAAFMPEHGALLSTIPADVNFVSKKHEILTLALSRDAQEISSAKDVTAIDVADARRAFAAVENLKLPAQFRYSSYAAPDASGTGGDDSTSDFAASSLLPYFETKTKDIDNQLDRVTSLIGEIEAHVRTVEGNATEQTHRLLRRQAAAAARANGGSVNGSADDLGKERVLELAAAMQMFEDAVLRVASKVGEVREGVIECTVGGNGASKGVNGIHRRK